MDAWFTRDNNLDDKMKGNKLKYQHIAGKKGLQQSAKGTKTVPYRLGLR